MKRCGAIAFSLVIAGLVGCGGPPSSPTAPAPVATVSKPAADPWILSCNDPKQAEPALLWNGLIGIRIGRDGAGTGADGKPLPFFSIDEYETTGEEKIKTLPNPIQFVADEGSNEITLEGARNYLQKLDMKTGLLTTDWDTTLAGTGDAHVRCETVMHPTKPMIAMRYTVTPQSDADLSFVVETNPDHPGMPNPHAGGGKSDVQTFIGLGTSEIKWCLRQQAPKPIPGASNTHAKQAFVGEASWSFGRKRNVAETPQGYDAVLQAAKKTWASRWQTDIEVDGPVADQQAIHSFLFYLRSAISPEGGMSISPYGLSNATYFGHVFWDADTWVFPALDLIDPKSAEAIVAYRGARANVAQENFMTWIVDGRPIATGELPPAMTGRPPIGFKYPWESSVSGHETVPGPSRFEDHITGSVWRAMQTAKQLGLSTGYPPTADADIATAGFFRYRIQKAKDGLYDLKGTMSPDENHVGDNDLYTNILAQEAIDRAAGKLPDGAHIKLRLPKDDKTFLTYDGDPLKSYKQAAAVLAIYPLQYPPAEKQARAMMDRFADKVSKNGPAMTDSIHSIIWSRIGEKAKAYKAWQDSWIPFTQGPLNLFSEKRSRQTTYFTTGAAGSLQSVIYGFLGFRLDYVKEPGAAWATQLKTGGWLSIKPNLPTEWNSVKFKNFNVLGRRYTLTVTKTAASVAPGE